MCTDVRDKRPRRDGGGVTISPPHANRHRHTRWKITHYIVLDHSLAKGDYVAVFETMARGGHELDDAGTVGTCDCGPVVRIEIHEIDLKPSLSDIHRQFKDLRLT